MFLRDQWLHIKSKDLVDFSFKYSVDEKHMFFITNLKQVYSSTVKKGDLESTCPGLEGSDESLLNLIFEKISDPSAKASFNATNQSKGIFTFEISSQIKGSVEKTTFRLENFNELGCDGVFYHLISPLILVQAQSAAREKKLLELIAAKDAAIAEYKEAGVSILSSINTSPFQEEQLFTATPEVSNLNEILESSGALYSQAIKRCLIKSEAAKDVPESTVGSKRSRRRFNEESAKKQEEVLSSVLQGSSKMIPKKKQNVRI